MFLGGLEAPGSRDAEVLVAGVVADIALHRTAAICGHADDDSFTTLSGARAQERVLEEPLVPHQVEAGQRPRHLKRRWQALARSYERFLRSQPLADRTCQRALAERVGLYDGLRRFRERARIERLLEATAEEAIDQEVELLERQDEVRGRRRNEDAGTGANGRQLRLVRQARFPCFDLRKRIEEARRAHEHMGRQKVGAKLNAQFVGDTGGSGHVVSPKTKRNNLDTFP